jgi:hypothetical protein
MKVDINWHCVLMKFIIQIERIFGCNKQILRKNEDKLELRKLQVTKHLWNFGHDNKKWKLGKDERWDWSQGSTNFRLPNVSQVVIWKFSHENIIK